MDSAATQHNVRVLGVNDDSLRPGMAIPARLTSRSIGLVYAGDRSGATLRCAIAMAAVLLCGVGMAWASGAARLATRTAKTTVWSLSLAGPLLLTVGLVIAAW